MKCAAAALFPPTQQSKLGELKSRAAGHLHQLARGSCPVFVARSTASARVFAPKRPSACSTCVRTVAVETPRAPAIWELDRPCATNASTSRSLGVSFSVGPALWTGSATTIASSPTRRQRSCTRWPRTTASRAAEQGTSPVASAAAQPGRQTDSPSGDTARTTSSQARPRSSLPTTTWARWLIATTRPDRSVRITNASSLANTVLVHSRVQPK